jgi:hypothetical protein
VTEQSRSAATVFLLYSFAFVSDFAALVYQVAWSRLRLRGPGDDPAALREIALGGSDTRRFGSAWGTRI